MSPTGPRRPERDPSGAATPGHEAERHDRQCRREEPSDVPAVGAPQQPVPRRLGRGRGEDRNAEGAAELGVRRRLAHPPQAVVVEHLLEHRVVLAPVHVGAVGCRGERDERPSSSTRRRRRPPPWRPVAAAGSAASAPEATR